MFLYTGHKKIERLTEKAFVLDRGNAPDGVSSLLAGIWITMNDYPEWLINRAYVFGEICK